MPIDPDTSPTIDPGEGQPSGTGQPGQKNLGPYEILEEIGRGGMGVVYKAFHPQLKRTVALKVLIAGEDASEEAIKRFHREAESVAKLGHHPNIVPIHDIGVEGKVHYFAMHFVDGKPLDRMIDDGDITPRMAASIAKRVANGLAHAHSHGILHRDIKPANILVNKAAEPQITDFGLAKDVDSKSQLTYSGATLGTPQYMPPEQADGRLKDIDARSDVYSLGATLYEMLAYEPPFTGETVINVIKKVLLDDPVSPRKKNPIVDRDLATISLKCLEKEPERRYASAGALSRDLESYLSGDPIEARPASFRYRAIKKARRHRGMTVTLLVSASLLILGGSVGIWVVSRGEREKEEALDKQAESDRLRDKNTRIAQVLLGAFGKLGEIHRDLKRSFYDVTKRQDDKRALLAEYEKKISAFGDSVPSDAASQATWIAVMGWLTRLGGFEKESSDLFERARQTDGEVPWGWLFEAMVWFSTYLLEQPLPEINSDLDELEFKAIPGETDLMKKARTRFDSLSAQVHPGLVGGDAAESFSSVLAAFRGMQREDLGKAEAGLTEALSHWAMAWMEEEILLARAKVRYLQKEFDGGMEDIRELIRRCPAHQDGYFYQGMLMHGKSVSTAISKKDPRAWQRRAIEAYSEAVKRFPWDSSAYQNRALTIYDLARTEEARGADPWESFEKALDDFHQARKLSPEDPFVFQNRGLVYGSMGETAVASGKDPLGYFQKALADFNEVVERTTGFSPAYYRRGITHRQIGASEDTRGLDPRESYRKAIADFDAALRIDPDFPYAYSDRGTTRRVLAEAEAIRGQDAGEVFLNAIEDFGKALRRDPENLDAYSERGVVRLRLGEIQSSLGVDPRENYLSAIRDFDEAIRISQESAAVYSNRSVTYLRLGKAQTARGEDPRESYRKSIEDGKKALRIDPGYAEAHNNLGNAYADLGDAEAARGKDPLPLFEKAFLSYEESANKNPGNWASYVNKGLLLEKLERYEESVAAYESAIGIIGEGTSHLKERLARAKLLASGPDWIREMARGDRRIEQGNYPAARENYEKCLQAATKAGAYGDQRFVPLLSDTHYNLACVYSRAAGEENEVSREPLKSKSLENLGKALELGWTDLGHIRIDTDLDPIRDLPEFKALLVEYEKKLKKEKTE